MKIKNLLISSLALTGLFVGMSTKHLKAEPYFQSLVCVKNTTNNDLKLQYGWHGVTWKELWIDA